LIHGLIFRITQDRLLVTIRIYEFFLVYAVTFYLK
jgi:hypothetical protein